MRSKLARVSGFWMAVLFACFAVLGSLRGSEVSSSCGNQIQAEFLNRWCPKAEVRKGTHPNFHKLVHPEWLSELIRGGSPGVAGSPSTYPGRGFVILEVTPDFLPDHNRFHIPNAVSIHTGEIESLPHWNLIPDDQLKTVIESKGIRWDHTVIVYGLNLEAVARVIWCLMYVGVEDVRLLNGGLDAWKRSGGILEKRFHTPEHVAFGKEVPGHPEFLTGTGGVHDSRRDSDRVLVSVRSRREFIGDISGYSYIKHKGRIPWAVWGKNGSKLVGSSGTGLNCFEEIQIFWEGQGISRDRSIIFYCGTGWRSSLAFFYAHLLGYPRISNYDGSWFEWSSDPKNPIAIDEPE